MRFKVKRNRFEAIPQGNRLKLEAWLAEMERAQQFLDNIRKAKEQGRMVPLALALNPPMKGPR